MRNPRLFFGVCGAIFLLLGATFLYRAYSFFQKDYFWTPSTRHEPLDSIRNSMEIYVRDKSLQQALRDKDLAVKLGDSYTPVQESDVSVRINHIQEVTRSPLLVGVGCASAGIAWLIALAAIRRPDAS
jgi:hypothetical protein